MRKSRLSLDEAKEKYPDWYERRIIKKERRGRWTVKRDLYDWWLHRIADEIRVGHRFYGIMTLAIYAKKCGIDEDELRRMLTEAIEELSEQERTVLSLYYYENLTMKEIGQVMGVSEQRIGQVNRKLVQKLREKLTAYMKG